MGLFNFSPKTVLKPKFMFKTAIKNILSTSYSFIFQQQKFSKIWHGMAHSLHRKGFGTAMLGTKVWQCKVVIANMWFVSCPGVSSGGSVTNGATLSSIRGR